MTSRKDSCLRHLFRSTFLVALILGAGMLGFAGTARATDTFEPNDTPEQAHPIQSGVDVESWISTQTDVDWYRFSTTETGTVDIRLTSLPYDYDIELYWYDPVGQSLDLIGWSYNSGQSDESIQGDVLYTGDFFIYVYPYDNYSETDSYILNATYPAAQPQPPVVAVTSPNGGESWEAGSSHSITYTATDPDTPPANLAISLDYSTNGGGAWTPIATGQTNTGTYSWTVPNAATTQARVRATASDGANQTSDASDANFAITQAPPANNVLSVGTASGPSGGQAGVPLGLQNESIVKALQTDVQFDPAIVSYASGAATGRASGMTFSAAVVGGNKVRVVMYYSDATTLPAGNGAIATLTFNLIGAAGTQTALTPSSTILSDPQGQPVNVTNQPGSIQVTQGQGQPPVATVTSPNGGETWQAGSSHAITYTATDPDTPPANLTISLDYSTNSGGTWTPIATGQTNTGTYSWTLPNVATTQARVRVTASDGALQGIDASNADFTITQGTPSNNVLSMGTGSGQSGGQAAVPLDLANTDVVKALQTDVQFDPAVVSYASGAATGRGAGMTFSASVVGGNKVRVVMYYSDATTLPAGDGAVASLTFHLIGAAGTQSALSPSATILSDPLGHALDVTNQAGSVSVTAGQGQPPAVTVTFPNGGESWEGGSSHAISYSATDPDTPPANLSISLDYSTNSGGTWTPIATGQANTGTYAWTVPNVATTGARIRVTASDGALQGSDASNGDFTITQGPLANNVLSMGAANGATGTQVSSPLGLANGDVVKALQTDVRFDPSIVSYVSGAAAGRAAGMTFSASVVGGDKVRVVMYYADATTLAAGTGPVANLTFSLIGATGTQTALTPSATVLSDPLGHPLEVSNLPGSISVGNAGPRIFVMALKNPGRVRTIHVFVTSDGALDAAPVVTAGTATVPVALIDAVHHVYQGIAHLPAGTANVTVSATGARDGVTGAGQTTVNF